MEFKSKNSWLFIQIIMALSLACVGFFSTYVSNYSWSSLVTAIVYFVFLIFVLYRVTKQSKMPIVTTNETGITVTIYGMKDRGIHWDMITEMKIKKLSLALNSVGKVFKIPLWVLSTNDKKSLIDEMQRKIKN